MNHLFPATIIKSGWFALLAFAAINGLLLFIYAAAVTLGVQVAS